MNVAWNKSPISAAEVVDELANKHQWQPRTIRTLLSRLVDKRALKASLDGKRFLYEPKVTMEACVQHESRSFAQRIFGGAPTSMLINLVKESNFTPDEIKELKKILNQKSK